MDSFAHATDRSGRAHRADHASDPTLCRRTFALLETAFPGVSGRHELVAPLGGAWTECSTPFVIQDGADVVAHVGLVTAPLHVAGRDVDVGCVHAVATAAPLRRRGLFRTLITEALTFAQPRFETLALTTVEPAIYQPFGFRVIDESWFTGRAPAAPGKAPAARPLDLAAAADRALLFRLLASRTPVSHVLGVRPERPIFLFNECASPLLYAADLDVVMVAEVVEDELRLFDVVGANIPPLDALVARIPGAPVTVAVYFTPDRLGPAAAHLTPRRNRREDLAHSPIDTVLMVRGPFAAEGQPLMLPRSGRT